MYDRMTSNGNGNKANMRICMLENLLKTTEAAGTSARVNSLKQVIRRNKMDMAPDAASSLDLMREIFQSEITREISQILDRHIRTTFSPAIENLRRNGHEVDEHIINMLFINILDAAKEPYVPEKENDSQLMAEIREPPPPPSIPMVKREDERLQMDLSPLTPHDVSRWNPERFGLTTLFVSTAKAAQTCGQTVSSFFNSNPRMFRYACDDTDRRMLMEDSRVFDSDGARIYLVCLDDVREFTGKSPDLEQTAFCLKEQLVLKIRRYAQPFFERLAHRHKQEQMAAYG